ncbi:MAG: HD-GYP domain-containing protein [Lachnospiraceae bacterium]
MPKSILFTFELEEGMVCAESVYSITGQLLVPENTVLDNTLINRLRLYNVTTVSIFDNTIGPQVVLDSESSYFGRIKSSPEFQAFKTEYIDTIETFHDNINEIVTRNTPIDPDELLNTTANLIDSSATSIHVFDMLHNMREFDDSTFAHCLNVALIARVLGQWLKMSPEDIDVLTLSGLLHDIGKLATPEPILTKPGKLTDDEYTIMKDHARCGYQYLKNQALDPRIKEACLFHHERCDGTGYPMGLSSDKIPDFAKIISICDVYDAMTAKRVYRNALCPFTVIKFLEEESFTKYDPRFSLVFLENVVSSYINTTVRLNNGMVGEVVLINKHSLSKPMLRCGNDYIDLSKTPDLKIEAII